MALTDLIIPFAGGKDNVGGIVEINLWEQLNSGWGAATSASGTYSAGAITSFDLPTSAANIGTYKFAHGTGKMDVSLSQEKGLALTTISIEGYIPEMSKLKFTALKTLVGKCLMGQVIMASKTGADGALVTTNFLVGWDSVLGSMSSTYLHSKFGLFLESIEASSGAAMEDGAGATVKFTAIQGELPFTTEED